MLVLISNFVNPFYAALPAMLGGLVLTMKNFLEWFFSRLIEKVYENALVIELENAGFKVLQQQNVKVYYENQVVGDYFADIIVNENSILRCHRFEKKHYKCTCTYMDNNVN